MRDVQLRSALPPMTRVSAALMLGAAAAVRAQAPFLQQTVDALHTGDCKGAGDIDGDGLADIVVAGETQLAWYRAPSWMPHFIAAPNVQFTTDMQVVDVDGDGDPDIVVPDGPNGALYWFENPRPLRDPRGAWPRHFIGIHGTWAHDVEAAAFGPEGRTGIVTRKNGICKLWLQSQPDVWTQTLISAVPGEGVGIGDVNGDGRPDVAFGGVWLENPGASPVGPWPEHVFTEGWPEMAGVRIAPIGPHGQVGIILSAAESEGRLSWFEPPADPRQPNWTEHIIDPSVDYVHTFQVVDMNHHGRLDIVFAEQQQSLRGRIGYYVNPGADEPWPLVVVGLGGSHNIRVADVLGTGHLSIVGANWQAPPISVWRNLSQGECYANCDGSSVQPVLNVADFSCFVSRFLAGDPWANCDGSTQEPTLNIYDFICFEARYAQGCP